MRVLPMLLAVAIAIAPIEAHGWLGLELPAPIPAKLKQWRKLTSYWTRWLAEHRDYVLVCRVRPLSRDNDELSPWLGGEDLAKRVGVPLWVLQELNRGYDLEDLTGDSRVRVPSHHSWPNYSTCLTPVWYERR